MVNPKELKKTMYIFMALSIFAFFSALIEGEMRGMSQERLEQMIMNNKREENHRFKELKKSIMPSAFKGIERKRHAPKMDSL